ncbi:S49 family peptidase [Escherichia coli]|nr:S49 family peptidase [Escherichia coli]
MTAELRNLPHIASMAFNEPLMLEPAYARVFFCALAGQLGISRLTDAVSGDSLTAGEAPATLALSVDDDGPRQARSYQVMNGIAVLPVSGTLVSRTRALQPYSGMTGYNGIIARLQQAASDPMVDGILLDMDTPGGMVAGAFDCADIIARVRDIKPVWALANDMNCSAGQLLASAASRRLVTQTARTGSIGVMMAHSNYGAALEKQGVEITLIYSGSHKVDGNPYSHLPDDVRETLQSRMDATRRMFAQKVSAYTGLSVQAVLDTEAAVYSGQEAIDAGLADELVNSTDAITVMRDALDARKSRLSGGRMTKETQSTTVSATASQADVTDVVPATEGENASAAQPDVNAQITAAVAAENSRIMGILNCEEAHGREEQARSYQVMNGIAVLPVSGTLVSRTRALQPYSGMTGYNGIIARLQQAASDPMVDGILLDMDTPGGMVAGAFDCADIIARVRDIKPVWALANDMNCSAGQLLASAASRRLVTQTARTGSIGVMMAHSNYGAALEKQGVEITLIYSGSHKVDGNPYSHLPDDVRETLQSRMDATRRMFAQKVSAYTGLSVQAVLDTEAAVYSGQEAIDAGLADELVNSTDAITVMRDALDARKSRLSGGRMTKETQSTTVSATASQADVTDVVPATEGENASAAQPDVNAQITAAVAAENSRIMGILNCEEAHGREEQARVLAETPGMTVETARRILAAAPQSAQARSDTALDRLMQGAPAPLAAGNPASDAVNDLLNTPV